MHLTYAIYNSISMDLKKKKNYTLLLKGLFGQLDEGPQKQELWTVLNTINFGTKLEEEFHLSQWPNEHCEINTSVVSSEETIIKKNV